MRLPATGNPPALQARIDKALGAVTNPPSPESHGEMRGKNGKQGSEGTSPAGRHQAGVMNKLEEAYSKELSRRWEAGEVIDWQFERLTLVLGHGGNGMRGVRYTPDFVVYTERGIELHETKGFLRDDARVKLRWAASAFPRIPVVLVRRVKGEWVYEVMKP